MFLISDPDTVLIEDVNVENTAPDEQVKVWHLPGYAETEKDAITGRQARVALNYAQMHYPGVSAAEAMLNVKRELNIQPNQPAFALVDRIFAQGRAASASNPLTPDQWRLYDNLVRGLATNEHFDAGITRALKDPKNTAVKARLLETALNFNEDATGAKLTVLKRQFDMIFGRPSRNAPGEQVVPEQVDPSEQY